MALTDLEPIRRRPDGSIDTGHYVLVAHEERRRQSRAFAEAVDPILRPCSANGHTPGRNGYAMRLRPPCVEAERRPTVRQPNFPPAVSDPRRRPARRQ
jgi:hypothetical protein